MSFLESPVLNKTQEAFGKEAEAKLVGRLRATGNLILSPSAIEDREVVGHIALSPVRIDLMSGAKDARWAWGTGRAASVSKSVQRIRSGARMVWLLSSDTQLTIPGSVLSQPKTRGPMGVRFPVGGVSGIGAYYGRTSGRDGCSSIPTRVW